MILAVTLLLIGDSLAAPTRVLDGGTPINVEIGHAAPFVHDMNGDGKRDLIVGQFGEGKARIYFNKGTDRAPIFKGFEWFKGGSEIASIPSG